MVIDGATSLLVDFEDLLIVEPVIAEGITNKPDEYLTYANNAAYDQLKIEDPEYARRIKDVGVTVRFRGLPIITPIRSLSSEHIGKLIMIEGIIIRATTVQPLVTRAMFECRRCGARIPVPQTGNFLSFPPKCTQCNRTGPFDFIQEESEFIDSQELRIQEYPEDLPPGQTPRSLDIQLIGKDLVDLARPGDRVYIVGIIRAEASSFPRAGRLRVFTLRTEANFVDAAGKESETLSISPQEEEEIIKLSKDPWIHRKIIRSIAPSIYGYEHIKEAIMYLLLGGIPKHLPDISIRGELNILLIGDPGTAKSQLLRYVQKIAPRGLYTSGRGTTAAGLTAAVLPTKSGGMSLEAGALVLADKGVACIDEIDKMRPEDRVAIHEAMEQHTISVAKGGIVATLNARAAILAAANPALGRYEPYRTVAENISLPVTILSRFDLIFVLRDVPEKEHDARMTEHILSLHRKGVAPVEPPISPDLLRKYVRYAKNVNPVLTSEAIERLKDFYLAMRSASEAEGSPVAITARQLESLVRISEAGARAALRKEILAEDAERAIAIMRRSLEEVGIDVSSHKFDIDIIMTGKPKSVRDKLQAVLSTLVEMERETGGLVKRSDLLDRLSTEFDITTGEAERLIGQLIREGTIYEPKRGYLKKT